MKNDPEIVFENDDFIAINKQAGMLSIPDRMQSQASLKDLLQERYSDIFTVHRLDKETSGIIIFAKHEAMHKYLSQLFENRETEKYYYGFITGVLNQKKGVVNIPIIEHPVKKGLMITASKGKESVTAYEMVEEFGTLSYTQFTIFTGRTHQIRVHMKFLGHPIACDELYGDGKPVLLSSIKKNYRLSAKDDEEKPLLSRLGLHAGRLVFNDMAGVRHELEAPLPKDMKALLQQLRKVKG
jgi:23S rRNA pseudouridine955/2504/2580 synthase/23S rRNA pseudouridine1911/1915/1917 synthase